MTGGLWTVTGLTAPVDSLWTADAPDHNLPTVTLDSRFAPAHEPLGQPSASLRVAHTPHRPNDGDGILSPLRLAVTQPNLRRQHQTAVLPSSPRCDNRPE